MHDLGVQMDGQNSVRTVTDHEWKGEEATFNSVGASSENGVRGERKTQAFELPKSLEEEVGGCYHVARVEHLECSEKRPQESNKGVERRVSRELSSKEEEETNMSGGGENFLQQKTQCNAVGPTQDEGPTGKKSGGSCK